MAKEAKAAREANGLVILQRGEKNCLKKIRCKRSEPSRILDTSIIIILNILRLGRVAADEMTDNPTSITLKYLQASSPVLYIYSHSFCIHVLGSEQHIHKEQPNCRCAHS